MTDSTPTTTASPTPNWLQHVITFTKAHEKLMIVGLASLLIYHFGERGITIYENHLKAKGTDIAQKIDTSATNTKNIEVELQALKAQVALNNTLLNAKIAASKVDLKTKQTQDATLPLPELANHWADLISLPGSATSQPNGTVVVTGDAAHTTVSELEKVPALTEQLLDTQKELDGCNAVTTQQTKDINSVKNDLSLEKQGRANDAKIAKDAQHKSWKNGFKWGVIVGVGASVALAVAAHI